MIDIGEPTHWALCINCGTVGGPYYDKRQANERAREHVSFRHISNAYSTYQDWKSTPRQKTPRTRTIFQG